MPSFALITVPSLSAFDPYELLPPMSFCPLVSVHWVLLCPPNSLVLTWSKGASLEQKVTTLCQRCSSCQPFLGACLGAMGVCLSQLLRTISVVGSTPAFGATMLPRKQHKEKGQI